MQTPAAQPQMVSLEATVIRACRVPGCPTWDTPACAHPRGVEPRGIVACWHREAWKRLACRLHPAIRRYLHRDPA